MRPQISTPAPTSAPALATELARYDARPGVVETVLRWQDIGGIEGTNLEWMLDRICAPQGGQT